MVNCDPVQVSVVHNVSLIKLVMGVAFERTGLQMFFFLPNHTNGSFQRKSICKLSEAYDSVFMYRAAVLYLHNKLQLITYLCDS